MPGSILRYFIIITFLISPFISAQVGLLKFTDVSRDSLLSAARTIIDSASCKVLITVDEYGIPRAREMAPFPPDEKFVIWFGTSARSRKVKQISTNPHVNVFYYDPAGKSYVTLSGTARIVNDIDKKEKYWVNGWNVFYPDREKDYILIEFTPSELEICSFKFKLFWDSETAEPHKLKLAGYEEH